MVHRSAAKRHQTRKLQYETHVLNGCTIVLPDLVNIEVCSSLQVHSEFLVDPFDFDFSAVYRYVGFIVLLAAVPSIKLGGEVASPLM